MTVQPKLPEMLERIAEVAGLPAAIKLAKDFGGSRIYIPQLPTPKTALSRSVGPEAAAKIAAAFGMGYLDVPIGPRIWNQRIVAAVAELLSQGRSIHQIANALGVTARTVCRCKRVLKGLPPERKKRSA